MDCVTFLQQNTIAATPGSPSVDGNEWVVVPATDIIKVLTLLKTKEQFNCSLLFSVTGTEQADCFEVFYHLSSVATNKMIVVKVRLAKDNPEVESASSLFSAANWHERETFDLLGIQFINHPNLKRILLPEAWLGHPLRKDYIQNDERLTWNAR
jgi:NADH/F420H2 dehydrogenase subunit C